MDDIPPEILGRSQKGQDSKIEAILNLINPSNKYFVEFGAFDGETNLNCWHLRENLGWTGLLLEGGQSNPKINLHDEFLTRENICEIFKKYNVPVELGFLSVDIDGNDIWLVEDILREYKPSVIMVETCCRFKTTESVAQKYNSNWRWSGKTWYGSSPLAFKKMAEKYGYIVVGQYLDDLFLVDKNVWPDDIEIIAELKQDEALYESHGNCVFNPDQFEIYE